MILNEAFQRMLKAFGPQKWWPGESQLEIIVGAVLTQNTNWRNVELALENLRAAGLLQLDALHRASAEQLEPLIRPAGYYRLKTRRLKNVVQFIVEEFNSIEVMFQTPLNELRKRILAVNGVGPETADSILLYAGEQPTFVIDAYTARILKRHGWIDTDANYQTMKNQFESNLPMDAELFNEYHALIVQTGKQHCRPTPQCDECPLQPLLPPEGIIDF